MIWELWNEKERKKKPPENAGCREDELRVK
jgi:hypothetical protein